jgi:hypothetical protein
MRRSAATVGSAVFFVVAPGVVAGLVPWLISGWQIPRPMSQLAIVRLAAPLHHQDRQRNFDEVANPHGTQLGPAEACPGADQQNVG